jgi:hypothetical protein
VACRHISRICSPTFTRTVLEKTFGKSNWQKQIAKQKAWPSAMPFSFSLISRSVFRVQLSNPRSAFGRSRLNPASIGLPPLGAAPAKSLISINKIHPTAKPNNYRQTSAKLFSTFFPSR